MNADSADTDSVEPAIEYAIDVRGVSKSFERRSVGYSTIKSRLLAIFSGQKKRLISQNKTLAVNDITLRIPKGNSVGIIGRNGSGKSTFLKILTGIYKPNAGSVSIKGRVASLIELGAGFHPDFTGRENLYLSAIMYGLSRREVDQRFDQIVDFAELAHVIDEPVRTYSSGMFMRLGFSVAVHTEPEVLLIDEVLAVGDAAFVSKCKERIAQLHKSGTTFLLVTHDLESVERWCNEAIWLHEGSVKDRGYPRRVIDSYRHFVEREEETKALDQESRIEPDLQTPLKEGAGRWGSREVEILSVELKGRDGSERRVLHSDDSAQIELKYRQNSRQSDIVFGLAITRADGLMVYGTNTEIERVQLPQLSSDGRVIIEIERLGLLEGSYAIDVAVHRSDGYPYDYHKNIISFTVRIDSKEVGVFAPEHRWLF